MVSQRVITRQIGNLRGFSTDSIFVRPSNVADIAVNIQTAPDRTKQLRRGYQCQIGTIGGMGTGTVDDPINNVVKTITIGTNGFVYNKLERQIYFYYDGRVMGDISGASQSDPCAITSNSHGLNTGTFLILRNIGGMTNLNNKTYMIDVTSANTFELYNTKPSGSIAFASKANPCVITSVAHGLSTGNKVMIAFVDGMVELNNIAYTVTVIDVDHFSLDGIDSNGFTTYIGGGSWYKAEDSSAFPAYISGGNWSIAFADQRYLIFTIFTDPRFLVTNAGWSVQAWSITPWGAPSGESITCNITVARAAQVAGNQINTNTATVQFGHELAAGDVIQFVSANGVQNQRNVLSTTANSITYDGYPVSLISGAYINQFFDIPFRRGFNVTSPYLISTFISTIINNVSGIYGLQIAINGDDSYPAAFIQIVEPVIIDSNTVYTANYWYWQIINSTKNPPLPGTANLKYQNSPNFENASTAVFNNVIYIANGWDYPQKYDGQTVYRAGMPEGMRPSAQDSNISPKPFSTGQQFQYIITYEQIDNLGNIVEGAISPLWDYTVSAGTAAGNVSVTNIQPDTGWNTNGAIAVAGTASVYGPDGNGFYYDAVAVTPGYTLEIGDLAYYLDTTCAQVNGAQSSVVTIIVDAGHGVVEGDRVIFPNSTPATMNRIATSITDTTITISGDPVTVADNVYMQVYKVSRVFGDVAIVDGLQSDVNQITVLSGHSVQVGDVVGFVDADERVQRRTITAIAATSVTVDGIPVSVDSGILIASENERADSVTLQRTNPAGATLGDAPISNNLRINIYRTKTNAKYLVDGKLYLVASIPNDSSGTAAQSYIDHLADTELGRSFTPPDREPNPPPVCKYLCAFGSQLFFAGGSRDSQENSDRVFFSEDSSPEVVPLATNAYDVPNKDDDITGIGVAGTTLVTTKNRSLWGVTGDFITGNIEVIQIAQGTNIGCVAHASIASVGSLMYFLHTNGVYSITENQIYPTDKFGIPVPMSIAINAIFLETNYLPQTRYVFKRAVACNYTQDNQYLLFLPCEDTQSSIRTANANSIILCFDYQDKNWYVWDNMNAAGGLYVVGDDLYFQERRFSAVDGNTANLYKQHRFYRLVDHADHAGPQRAEWRSSWEDLKQPEVRKKFSKCILLMDRLSSLQQYNDPKLSFASYVNRIPNLKNTIVDITQVDNIRNSSWSYSGWGWNYWSGYQDSFITVNLKQGTVAKSIQVGFTLQGINMDIRFAGFQLEAIPENRMTVVR